jgi:hypothetical protein
LTRGRGVNTASRSSNSIGIESQVRRSVRPSVPQCEPDLPVATDLQPVLREWRSQRVATEALQAIALIGSRHEARMKIEPVDVGVSGAQCHGRLFLRRVAAPAHAHPRTRAQRHSAFDGRRRRGREDRCLLRPEVRRPDLGAVGETASLE